MTEHAQPKQRPEPGQPQEPATKPTEAALSDQELDQVAGGGYETGGTGGDQPMESLSLNF